MGTQLSTYYRTQQGPHAPLDGKLVFNLSHSSPSNSYLYVCRWDLAWRIDACDIWVQMDLADINPVVRDFMPFALYSNRNQANILSRIGSEYVVYITNLKVLQKSGRIYQSHEGQKVVYLYRPNLGYENAQKRIST